MKKMIDIDEIEMTMCCQSCDQENFSVGQLTTGSLIVFCNNCELITARFDKWPDDDDLPRQTSKPINKFELN